jgi:3-dehydroquinate synthase
MTEVAVSSPGGSYQVIVERGLAAGFGTRLRDQGASGRLMVIADEHTAPLLGAAIAREAGGSLFTAPAGEATKAFSELERACAAAVDAGLDRGSTIVAVGGGVVGDLAGVVAAVYMRGIGLVHVPTTLLAMVDSAIGGKAAVNLPQGKNLVGAFKSPRAVYIDPNLLSSLPPREYLSGLAEVLKYSMIADEQLYDSLLANNEKVLAKDLDLMTEIVSTCCAIKAGVVSRDEREDGERAILNYGHTFGHALEAATAYERFTHGEAISVGMAVAARIGSDLDVTPKVTVEQQVQLLTAYNLPQHAGGAASVDDIAGAISHDKKARGGETPWVLLEGLGQATAGHQVTAEVAERAIAAALAAS